MQRAFDQLAVKLPGGVHPDAAGAAALDLRVPAPGIALDVGKQDRRGPEERLRVPQSAQDEAETPNICDHSRIFGRHSEQGSFKFISDLTNV